MEEPYSKSQILATNLKIKNEIDSYLEQRATIQKNAVSLLKTIKMGNLEKQQMVEELQKTLSDHEEENTLLQAQIQELQEIPSALASLRREYMDIYKETASLRQFVSKKSFKNKKLKKVLLSQSEGNLSASAKKTSHVGITFEDDERQLFKRLDVVQINAGTPTKLVEWIAESKTEDKMNYYTILCLTYRYFMTSEELLAKLVTLYHTYTNEEDKAKRMNVVNFLQHW
eukprot:CAMPEP_0117039070 /NCGR_PEP_ID=MMETSP0472-20121206/27453_1 /TAXON_ID=693140 ORGANISM="Tiarina fusus, Strain LIS" /NCGR_SAMPLE_ID=MMETSP0472 /ASSEMBLY_ACC=CAM_ASM_000603 /LENGTH=227 /DNA_ID=CAMNT_0004749477 /DNA_START=14 /DNA_END=694 /DNA_ORIENTATION=-